LPRLLIGSRYYQKRIRAKGQGSVSRNSGLARVSHIREFDKQPKKKLFDSIDTAIASTVLSAHRPIFSSVIRVPYRLSYRQIIRDIASQVIDLRATFDGVLSCCISTSFIIVTSFFLLTIACGRDGYETLRHLTQRGSSGVLGGKELVISHRYMWRMGIKCLWLDEPGRGTICSPMPVIDS
jgi:hypothetical protein